MIRREVHRTSVTSTRNVEVGGHLSTLAMTL
jgi:hypothetical protein